MTITIDFGEYGLRSLSDVPPELGPGLAAIVTTALSWDDAERQRVNTLVNAELDRRQVDNDGAASDRLEDVLGESGSCIGTWSCQDGAAGEPIHAGPWLDTIAYSALPDVAEVAAAVLARDFGLITAEDFAVLTAWWTAAGLPLPDPRPGARWPATIEDAERNAEALRNAEFEIPGWPLAAVAS